MNGDVTDCRILTGMSQIIVFQRGCQRLLYSNRDVTDDCISTGMSHNYYQFSTGMSQSAAFQQECLSYFKRDVTDCYISTRMSQTVEFPL